MCLLRPGEQGEGEREDAGNGSGANICLGRAETKETSRGENCQKCKVITDREDCDLLLFSYTHCYMHPLLHASTATCILCHIHPLLHASFVKYMHPLLHASSATSIHCYKHPLLQASAATSILCYMPFLSVCYAVSPSYAGP